MQTQTNIVPATIDDDGTINYINAGGHKIEAIFNSSYSYDLYVDGTAVDFDISLDFYSNGINIYYTKQHQIYKLNIETYEKKYILSDDYAIIQGIYNDKYLYYGSMKHVNTTGNLQDTIVYDLEENQEINYIPDVEQLVITDYKLYTAPCTGSISELNILEWNLDGSPSGMITDKGAAIIAYNNRLYYSEYGSCNADNIQTRIVRYDPKTHITDILTDYQRGTTGILYEDYAEFYDMNYQKYKVYYKDIKVTLNGEKIKFDQIPVMENGRVLVPIRMIFETLGYTVSWDEKTQTATADKGTDKIIVQVNNPAIKYSVDGAEGIYNCDVAPKTLSDRIIVPVRAIAECAGCNVDWADETYTVVITN